MKINFDFACQDDCLDKMLPSDLRKLVAERDALAKEVDAANDRNAELVEERDALAAQSEILRDALNDAQQTIGFLSHHLRGRMGDAALMDMAQKADFWSDTLKKTPQQCLRDVKAEAIKDFVDFNKGRFTNAFDMYTSEAMEAYIAKVRQGGA